ncbi:MAG: precorrin-6Y C5,15-methyltransferase (decarboxylating) subunit CbiT, partial [Solirubrobacteraceae bacterium]|nr:precorrin-6Y C5,15-methyltransferase (decarboxylating) subunit CbiT [Solirubrobacteraceae bacterium]
PDELYGGDGQLTRAELRAIALASLAPRAGERLWDVGAGSGTIAIEWCRGAAGATAVAIERREDRARTIGENASVLGAPGVQVVVGAAPLALEGLPQPDAIFVGGGPAVPGLIDGCWQALRAGGRLVAAAVTLEGEAALAAAHATYGGRLVRIETSHAEPLGSFTGWKPQRPVVQWSATKEPQG